MRASHTWPGHPGWLLRQLCHAAVVLPFVAWMPVAAAAQALPRAGAGGNCYYYDPTLVDPVSQLLNAASITTDRDALSAQGRAVIGIAADGAAKIVMRVRLPFAMSVPVDFSLDAADGAGGTTGMETEDGSLSTIDAQDASAKKVQVQSSEVNHVQWAFAIYNAPLDFVRARTADANSVTRDLVISYKVNNELGSCDIPLRIHRPLVFPIHGIWSSADGTWSNFAPLIRNGAPDPRFTIGYANYKQVSSGPIIASATMVGLQLQNAILKYKLDKNIAAVQADMLAHSLGGVVARTLPALLTQRFVRNDNFKKGDAHKLITIASPHLGSRMAAQIVSVMNQGGSRALDFLEDFFERANGINRPFSAGAVADLNPSSPFFNRLDPSPLVPSHYIVGQATAADKQLDKNKKYEQVVRWVITGCPPSFLPGRLGWGGLLCDLFTDSGFTLVFGRTGNHDIFIEQLSQQGGLAFGASASLFAGVVHSSTFAGQPEPTSPAIAGKVIDLLNSAVKSSAFRQPNGANPRPGETTDGNGSGNGAGRVDQHAFAASPPVRVSVSASAGIRIVSPANGTMVNAGDAIGVDVQATGDAALAFVFAGTESDLDFKNASPFHLELHVPADVIGPRTIAVLAGDLNGNEFLDSVIVNVQAPTVLMSLATLEPQVTLLNPGLETQISVLGTFGDGLTRNVTLDPNTAYSSSDPNVATVDRGLIKALHQGATTIGVSNAGKTTSVAVTVNADGSVPVADLTMTQAAPSGPLAPGSEITYTIGVTNQGPAAATDVLFSDTLPGNTTFVSCAVTGGGVCEGSAESRAIAFTSLAAGASATITLVARIGVSTVGETLMTNLAYVSSSTIDPTPSNNSARVTTRVANGPAPGPVKRYFAEGVTGPFWDTAIALFNPGSTPASVVLRFLKDDATTVTHDLTIPPGARRTVRPGTLAGLESTSFSTVIESDVLIIADRTITWGGGYGSHAETAVEAPATTWYLAEGATSDTFQLFYLLQNPNSTATTTTIRFLRPAGAPLVRTYELPPLSRTTIYVNQVDPALAWNDVSAVLQSTQPIIVERSMYLNRPGEPFSAGHCSAGVTAPAMRWFFAEGATGPFFELFILLANPSDQEALVEMRYLTSTADVFTKDVTLAPNSRTTIWVDEEMFPGLGKALANAAVSTTVTSLNGVGIIAERSMWWPEGHWYEAHNSPGATSTGTRWALADGEVGGASRVQTYVLIANTSSTDGSARVTLRFEDATTAVRTYHLPPNSRTNVPVGDDFPMADGKRFGTIVESLGETPAQIVVEHAMYSNGGGVVWAAGTNALGTRLP